MKKQYLFLLLTFFPLFGFGQNASEFGRTYNDKLPENFKINIPEVREHIYSGIPSELKDEEYPRSSYRFADQSAISTHNLLSGGSVYSDWEPLENYVNEVLKKVMPGEMADDQYIKAYILKDGNYNAFMIPSGMMFINIGLFDFLESEAALASILAHELAHYKLKHSVKEYVKAEEGKFRPGFLMKNRYAYKDFSIQSELEADSLSMVWMAAAGYNVNGTIQSFEAIERIEKNLINRLKTTWEIKETTHPRSEKRLKKIRNFIEEEQANGGRYFMVSKEQFVQYKEQAKPEILKHLLHDFNYSLCIEKAFKYHVLDTENAVYVYYLMEAIRRKCYLSVSHWKKKFLTDRYYETVETKKGKYKKKMTAHIFDETPTDILCLNKHEAKKVSEKFYWEGDVKFTTYEEAFMFFNQIAELYEEPECILSNALSVSFDKKRMDKSLKKYLENEQIQNPVYADYLLNDSIKSSLNNKTLTVFSNFILRVRHGKEEISLLDDTEGNAAYLKNMLNASTKDFENRTPIYLPDLRNTQLNDYTLLQELESLSFSTIFARGEKTELYILDPRYWEIMSKLGVNEIEFVNCVLYDVRNPDKSLDTYKELVSTDFEKLLAETKRNRYIEVFVTSVRIVEGGVMKVKYYGEQDKLAYKQDSYEQIVAFIRSKLERKDKKVMDLDTN